MRPGDRVLLSGTMGDHGMAVMLARGDLDIEADIASDTAAVSGMVEHLLGGRAVARGSCATPPAAASARCATSWPRTTGLGVVLDEPSLPVAPMVNGACEMLGIDPLYVANEGKVLAVVAPEEAAAGLAALRAHPLGRSAVDIGEIVAEPAATVVLRTAFGGTRIVDMLVGDPLPRIC